MEDPKVLNYNVKTDINDITEFKKFKEMLQRHTKEIAAVNEMAIELADTSSLVDIYQLICKRLKSITGALVTGVMSYDPQRQELKIENICADSKLITKADKILGRKMKQLRFRMEPYLPECVVSERVRKLDGIYELMFGDIPKTVANTLERILGIGNVYGLALHHGGKFMGTMSVIMASKQPSLSLEMLEAFANLSAVVLQRKKAEDALNRAYGELETLVHERTAELVESTEALKTEINERKKAEEALKLSESELRQQKLALEQKNIALGEIIGQIEEEKNKIKDEVITNVNELLIPTLKKVKMKGASKKYIDLLQRYLEKLTSSFGRKLTKTSFNLTPKEVEICNMVEGGLTSKEISDLLNVSYQTIQKHRKNIRKKLRIANKDINLISFLQKL